MFCPNCGKENAAGSTHCSNCGANIVLKPGIEPGTSYITMVEYAGFWKRLLAYVIDYIILGIANQIIGIVLAVIVGVGMSGIETDAEDNIHINITYLIILFSITTVIGWLYYAIMESSSSQATLGKRALGIVVTDSEGNRISFFRATGRHFAKFISSIILLIGYFMIAFTQKKQGLHDMIADTLVVSK